MTIDRLHIIHVTGVFAALTLLRYLPDATIQVVSTSLTAFSLASPSDCKLYYQF
jgi:hypothetical protein